MACCNQYHPPSPPNHHHSPEVCSPQCAQCKSKKLRKVSPSLFTLFTTSKNISFPKSNEILCQVSSATGENVKTMEGFKTCVLTFHSPTFVADYVSNIEKRYSTIKLSSPDLNSETYGLTFLTRNIAGNLRSLVIFELNGNAIKTEIMGEIQWETFSMILHENMVTVLIDNSQWHIQYRNVLWSNSIYNALFNVNHDKTEIKNITFSYFFQNPNTNKLKYTIPNNLPIDTNTFRFDYSEGAIHELRDICGGIYGEVESPITLYVQNMNIALGPNNRIPIISTIIKSEQGLSRNAYITQAYLSTNILIGTPFDVLQQDTSYNIQTKLMAGKTVMQQLSYVNTDGSGQILSDIQVYM